MSGTNNHVTFILYVLYMHELRLRHRKRLLDSLCNIFQICTNKRQTPPPFESMYSRDRMLVICELRRVTGGRRERMRSISSNSTVYHQISLFINRQILPFPPSFISPGYPCAPLITMFTTCWLCESHVGFDSNSKENKGKEF